MKKSTILCMLLLFLLSTPLLSRSLGYGLGYYGEEIMDGPERVSSGVEVSLAYQPWLLEYGNPSLVGKVAFGTDQDKEWIIPYLQAGLNIDLVRTMNHPFNVIAHNVIAYTPAIGLFYQMDPMRESSSFTVEMSPLKLSQKDFWYEFFSPFISFNLDEGVVDSWGITLVRYTYFVTK
ncbi:MAG: hypothetical protein PWP59_353 [Sphaerochaeta sp.]|nr:hypothetical protein [Sphaerochaeta sp.]